MSEARRIFERADDLFEQAADAIAAELVEADRRHGAPSIVLAGGTTPRPLYERLAGAAGRDVPWPRVRFYWGDERYVPYDDARSNARLARDTLIHRVPAAAGHVHPLPTTLESPVMAARAYDALLRARSETPFDVVLLGIGDDGHTASLFPRAAALDVVDQLVVPASAPAEPKVRLTLTFPALFNAAATHVIVLGASKAEALAAVGRREDWHRVPAARLRESPAPVTWWMDRDAASGGADAIW